METLLLIIGIAAVALLLVRPAPRPQVIYVPIEIAEARGNLGCLPHPPAPRLRGVWGARA